MKKKNNHKKAIGIIPPLRKTVKERAEKMLKNWDSHASYDGRGVLERECGFYQRYLIRRMSQPAQLKQKKIKKK